MVDYIPVTEEAVRKMGTDQSGTCWWCGNEADTREHKHKKSTLRRMWTEDGLHLEKPGAKTFSIPSPNSKAVKFSKTLCQHCNNVRSQPFDTAYDQFYDFIQSHLLRMTEAKSIDWEQIYGSNWRAKARHLGCYAIKSFGCWMADDGFAPPREWTTFLDGGELMSTRLMLYRNEVISLVSRALAERTDLNPDYGFGTLGARWHSDAAGKNLTAYESYSYINDIVSGVSWVKGTGHGRYFWTEQRTRLTVWPVTDDGQRLVDEIGNTRKTDQE